MRNLKRVLSMALASVMVLGLTVVGASAANFNDQAEIEHTTAAAVMSAIGVLEGNEKGDFMPDQVLTREQAAKIICYMLMGPENAEKLGVSGTKFSDVAADRWSAPYVAYCANMGILAGDGTGKFNPEGELTGHAFAKMLLVALGYDATIQNYVGNSWSINVATDAVNAGIYVDGTTMSNPMTRDEAAQMAFQTLTADMVQYENKGSVIELPGGGQIVSNPSSAKKVAVSKDAFAYDGKEDEVQQFCEKYFKDLEKVSTGANDDLGRPAVTWTYDDEDIDTVTDSADKTLVVNADAAKKGNYDGAVEKLLDKTVTANLKAVNGKTSAPSDDPQVGDVMYLYETAKDTYDVYVARYSFAIVDEIDTDVTSADEKKDVKSYITLDKNDDAKDDIKDTDFADFAYEEGDAIAVVMNEDGDKVLASYAVESVEGKVTSKAKDNSYVSIDGTKYEFAGKLDASKIELGSTYTLYTDANGYVIYTEGENAVASLDNVYYVNKVRMETSTWGGTVTFYAQVVALDGTVEEVKLAKVDGKTVTDNTNDGSNISDENVTAGLYTLKSTTKGYEATTFASNSDFTKFNADQTEIKTSTVSLTDSTHKAYIEKETVFVVITGDADDLTVKTYTGSANVKTDGGTVTVISNGNKTGTAQYVVIVDDEVSAPTDKDSVLFLASVDDVVEDGFTAVAYDLSGKKMEIVISDEGETTVNKLYTYSVNDDDVYTLENAGADTLNGKTDMEGYLTDATIDGVYNSRVSFSKDGTKYDFDASDAVIVDGRDEFKAPYDKEIYNLSRLSNATEDATTVTATLYVDDYVQVIFITGVE